MSADAARTCDVKSMAQKKIYDGGTTIITSLGAHSRVLGSEQGAGGGCPLQLLYFFLDLQQAQVRPLSVAAGAFNISAISRGRRKIRRAVE